MAFLCALVGPLAAQQPDLRWTRGHTVGAVASTAAIAADCASTYQVVVREGGGEMNPFLGRHPSGAHLVSLCTIGAGLNLLVGWAVPAKTRTWWFRAVAVVEVGFVLNNVLRR